MQRAPDDSAWGQGVPLPFQGLRQAAGRDAAFWVIGQLAPLGCSIWTQMNRPLTEMCTLHVDFVAAEAPGRL